MTPKKFPYYPIFIDVEDREVVIVGGGVVCARKAETMMRYGAKVTRYVIKQEKSSRT